MNFFKKHKVISSRQYGFQSHISNLMPWLML